MQYIQNDDDLAAMIRSLQAESVLAVDTEAAGYHRYADTICLVQLSTHERTFVVDALAADIGAFRPLFADPAHEIVLHDADYDMRLFARDHDIGVGLLFDTKLAAQFMGEPSIGLAGLVGKYLDIRLDKKHQRADWAQRPLPDSFLEYAADDTRYLPSLRDTLHDALQEMNRLQWAQEEFALRAAATFTTKPDDTAFLRLKNIRDLGPRQLAALRELYGWRDGVARQRDVAPFRVLNNDVLVTVARRMPESVADLRAGDGVDAAGARHAADLFAAVERARRLPEDALPARKRGPRRPPPDPLLESRIDAIKGVRDAAAATLGLDRGFLMPRQQLEDIAKAMPTSMDDLLELPDVRRWQVEALGERLLKALR